MKFKKGQWLEVRGYRGKVRQVIACVTFDSARNPYDHKYVTVYDAIALSSDTNLIAVADIVAVGEMLCVPPLVSARKVPKEKKDIASLGPLSDAIRGFGKAKRESEGDARKRIERDNTIVKKAAERAGRESLERMKSKVGIK